MAWLESFAYVVGSLPNCLNLWVWWFPTWLILGWQWLQGGC